MHNTQLMKIGHPTDNVLEEPASLQFLQFGLLDNIVKELSLLNVLHDQKQVPRSFDNLARRRFTS